MIYKCLLTLQKILYSEKGLFFPPQNNNNISVTALCYAGMTRRCIARFTYGFPILKVVLIFRTSTNLKQASFLKVEGGGEKSTFVVNVVVIYIPMFLIEEAKH